MIIERKDVLRFYGWSKNPCIKECAMKAYTDVTRPLSGIGRFAKEEKETYELYKEDIYTLIKNSIATLLKPQNHVSFDAWHNAVCKQIICKPDCVLPWIKPETRLSWPDGRYPYGAAQSG